MARRGRRTSPPHASFGRGGRCCYVGHPSEFGQHGRATRQRGPRRDCHRVQHGWNGPEQLRCPVDVLLPELLYRHAFGRCSRSLRHGPQLRTACPSLTSRTAGMRQKNSGFQNPGQGRSATAENLRAVARRIPEPAKSLLKGVRSAATHWRSRNALPNRLVENLDYMPCYRYRNHWPRMPAFALPSFLRRAHPH